MARWFLLAVGLCLTVISCTKSFETSRVSGDLTVRAMFLDDAGVPSVQNVMIPGIEDLSTVRTESVRFTYAPKVTPKGLVGSEAHARFIRNSEGIHVPADALTQIMTSIAAQFVRIRDLDRRAGAQSLVTWPRNIGVNVQIRDAGGMVENNMFYDGPSDSILVVPYADGKMPLAMNPGALAHEHFHALFFAAVLKPLIAEGLVQNLMSGPEVTRIQTIRATYLKSINEGLADVWGWVHSGDLTFIAKSMTDESKIRRLSLNPNLRAFRRLLSPSEFAMITDRITATAKSPGESLSNFSYGPGGNLSQVILRILQSDIELSDPSLREATAKRLIKALPVITETLRQSSEEKLPDFYDTLKAVLQADELTSTQKEEAAKWLPSGAVL